MLYNIIARTNCKLIFFELRPSIVIIVNLQNIYLRVLEGAIKVLLD